MKTGTRILASLLALNALLPVAPVSARVPEPDHIFFGVVRKGGVPITTGVVTAITGSATAPVARYTLDGLSSNFVLRIPIDSLSPQEPGTARPGDTARVYVNGKLAATTTVGDRGTATAIDLDEDGATTTTIASSANPAPLGVGLTLTATVSAVGSASGVPTGSVTFKDGTTALGTSSLDGAGHATLVTSSLSAGTHALVAEYAGALSFGSSLSNPLPQLVLSQTATVLSSSANPATVGQSLSLAADVRAVGGPGTPSGSVTFRDGAQSLGTVGLSGAGRATLSVSSLSRGTHALTAEYLGSAPFFGSWDGPLNQAVSDVAVCSSATFASALTIPSGLDPRSLAAGDWNLDGHIDLAVTNAGANELLFLLGNGAGSFQAAGPAMLVGLSPQALVAGDLNHDGKLDLAVAARDSGQVRTFLGDGAGAFTASSTIAVSSPRALALADFNLDGRPDLAVANQTANTVTILAGDGAGSFTANAPVAVGTLPTSLAAGDLNMDGRPDLVVANANSNDLSVLLGDGFGSLTLGASLSVPGSPQSVVMADFNSDGKPDLASVQSVTWDARVLLGDGAGAFAPGPGTPFSLSAQPRSLATGDFNLDGKVDAAIANAAAASVTVLLGNGAGALGGAITQSVGTGASFVATIDANDDGRPDLAVANATAGTLTLLMSNCRAQSATTLTSSGNPSAWGQSVLFTATVAPAPPAAGRPGGSVTFRDGEVVLGTAAVNGAGEASLLLDGLKPGTHAVTASYEGDASFAASASSALNQAIAKVASVTSLLVSPTSPFLGPIVTLAATVQSSLPGLPPPTGLVTFRDGATSLTTNALSAGSASFVTGLLSAGSHTLSADYSGDANYASSTFSVNGTVASRDATLAGLALSKGSLSPGFNSATTSYTAMVGTSDVSLTATPTAADALAALRIRINGGAFAVVTSGSPSGVLPLNVGLNTIDVQVTAQDGTTVRTYTVVVTRPIAPAAPTIGSATGANARALVSFTAPSDDGGSPITGYTATCGAKTATGTTSPITVTGLTNGVPVTCTVRASNGVGAGAASAASNAVTPEAPRLSVNYVSMVEGNAGSGTLTFTVTASASLDTVTVSYATQDGTASAGSDYTSASGTLTFDPGQTSKAVAITVLGDTLIEPDEMFSLVLSGASSNFGSVTVARDTGVGAILNDDARPTSLLSFTASPILVNPDDGSTLSWSAAPGVSLAINGSPVPGPSGSTVVVPQATTVYTLVGTDSFGPSSRVVTVSVNDGTAGLGAPAVTAPTPGQVVGVTGVGFTWTAVGGADRYDLRVLDASTGTILFSGSLLGAPSTSTLISLVPGSYRFTVRACAGGLSPSSCGPFASRAFTVSPIAPSTAPTVTSPAQDADLASSTQVLSWTAVPPDPALPGLSYEVLLRDLAQGTTGLQITVPSPTLSTVFTLSSSSQWELKVRACQAGCGPWSIPVTFSVTLPSVPAVAPVISSCTVSGGNALSCAWGAVAHADTYQVLVVQPPPAGPGGGALAVAAVVVSGTNVTLPVPLGPATVLIGACNGDGCGPNAQASINVAGPNSSVPNLGTPMAGTTVTGPSVLFTWNRVPGDNGSNTWYRLFVQDLSRQSTAFDVFTKQNYYSAYFRAEGARYDALVVANPGSAGEAVGPAQGFNVLGASAAAPTMVSPGHNGSVAAGNVQLGWSPVPGATLYEYYVAVLGQSAASARGVTPGLLARVPLTGASGGTVYSGIVRACPAGAICVAGSEAGWGPWSNAPGGPGVTNFTVIP